MSGSESDPPELEFGEDSDDSSIDDEKEEEFEQPRRIPLFEIPTSDDMLTVQDSQAFHVVEDGDKDEEQCLSEIEQFGYKLSDPGWRSLKDHFDAFFSLAKVNTKIKDVDIWLKAVKKLLECFQLLINGSLMTAVNKILRSPGQPTLKDIELATTVANYLLMLVYLLNRLAYHLENENMKRLLAMEKKKGARKIELDSQMERWVVLRERIIEQFTHLCDLKATDAAGMIKTGVVKYLWRPPEANKGLIMAMTETIFKFFDNPYCKAAASLKWLELNAQLIRKICLHFEYSSRMAVALVEKTVNLEYLREATTTKYPFIQPIINVSEKNDMEPLLTHMIRHLGVLVDIDFNTTSIKPYTMLMTTMAELAPDILRKQLSSILPYLQSDIASFRATVLTCFSHLLCSKQLSEANCIAFARNFRLRQSMLQFCRDHLQDENATVRTKAVQVWSMLAENKRIPADELQKSLIFTIGERLLDKSLLCRKAALQFLFKFLEANPYGHDFDYALHVQKLHELNVARKKVKESDPVEKMVNAALHVFDAACPSFVQHFNIKYAEYEKRLKNGQDLLNADIPAEADSQLFTMSIVCREFVSDPSLAATVAAYLVLKGDNIDVDTDAPFEKVLEDTLEIIRKSFVQYKRDERLADNEAELQMEDRIHDHKFEMEQLGKEITQLINKIMVAKEFSECIPKAMRAVLVGDLPEMKEAMQFVVICKHFNVTGANQAVRQLCSLVWRHSQDVRKEVLKTAESLFVSTNKDPTIKVKSTVSNLFSVLEEMKDEERASVEEVISKMAVTELPDDTARYVWKMTEKGDNKQKRVALQLLGILAKSDKQLRSYLRNLQDVLKNKQLSPKVRVEALNAIANMADMSTCEKHAFRIPRTDSLFQCIETFVIEEFLRAPDEKVKNVWYDAMQAALSIYFDIAKDTDAVVSRLAAKIFTFAHRIAGAALFYTEQCKLNLDEASQQINLNMKRKLSKTFCYFMERCLTLAGEIALRIVIHVDVTWFREVKKLPEIISSVKNNELAAKTITSNNLLEEWEFRSAKEKGIFKYSMRDENNPHGDTHESSVRAHADDILNTQLFKKGKLLSRFAPFIIYNLRAESSPACLRDAAAVAFSKFMLVSQKFSKKGAPTFFTVMNYSHNPIIRHNLVVAAGDLCLRMPNLVELYSNNVYSMTKDESTMVRETAILVLTHLLTNQLLKQNKLLADVAKLITDPVQEISILTREFFHELGGEKIFILLPDIISRLSSNSREVSLQQFKTILSFLLQQLSKDKFLDSLVEKLCSRFAYIKSDQATAKNSKIAHYFSFCISQMNLSEKAFIKMRDNLNNYATFMEDSQVYEDFKQSLEKLSKSTKSVDLQNDVEDFLNQLASINSRGLTGDELAQRVAKGRGGGTRGRPRGAGAAAQQGTKQARRRRAVEFSSEDSSNGEPSDIEGN